MYSISLCCVWLTLFLIVASGDSSSPSNDDGTYCDGTGWVAYHDEKCYKLIKQWTTRDEAKDACAQEGADGSIPQLAIIKSIDEQSYLSELVFDTSAVKFNVWLGAKRITGSNKFVWDDGSVLGKFTNWADASPTEELEKKCVVMQSKFNKRFNDLRTVNGKWRDVICDSVNYVICEKLPRWSFTKLKQTLLSQRKELDEVKSELNDTRNILANTRNELIETKNELNNTKTVLTSSLELVTSELDHAKKNPVPVDFIYVQLPHQPGPKKLWSTAVVWKDITSEFSGAFFRAEGTGSAEFGTVQPENVPKVTQVRHAGDLTCSDYHWKWDNTTLAVGGWSSGVGVYSGQWAHTHPRCTAHQFYTSGGEVRPRNMAIRIWKRIV